MRKWKIKGKVCNFPKEWALSDVMRFVNTDIKVCHLCHKVDVNIDHFNRH